MTTTNLGMALPTVGADADAWGTELNTALTVIDTYVGLPSFFANRNGVNQTGLTATAINKISFNNVLRNDGSYYDGTTNFRFTPLLAGLYRVTLAVVAASSATETCQAIIYKNGADAFEGPYMSGVSSASFNSQMSVDITMNGSTDYLEGNVYLPSGVTTLVGGIKSTFFSAYRIRP